MGGNGREWEGEGKEGEQLSSSPAPAGERLIYVSCLDVGGQESLEAGQMWSATARQLSTLPLFLPCLGLRSRVTSLWPAHLDLP